MRSLVTFAAILVAVTADSRIWEKHRGMVLRGKYSSGVSEYKYLEEAQIECMMRDDCGGITYNKSSKKYSLRSGVNLVDGPKKTTSWLLKIPIRETEFDNGRVMSCSGKEINEMGCSCLADFYNANGCSSNLSYDPGSCVTYNHHCKHLKDGKKKEKTCCRAALCYINKHGC